MSLLKKIYQNVKKRRNIIKYIPKGQKSGRVNPRTLRGSKNSSIVLRRTVVSAVMAAGAGFNVSDAFYFEMTQVNNFSEITAMFKKIKLLNITIKWLPAISSADAGIVISKVMYTAVNPDNINTGVPTPATIREQNNVSVRDFTKTFTIKFVPVIKNQVGQAGVTTYYTDMPANQTYLSPSQAGVKMYGLDWSIPDTGLANTVHLGKWEITYNIHCSAPK